MNDNPTLRPFESYLDEVAATSTINSLNFRQLLLEYKCGYVNAGFIETVVIDANRRMLEDAFKAQKDTQAAYHQLFGFGIGYTCEINDLLSGLGMTKKEWDDIKSNGGVTTLLERHLEEIEMYLQRKFDHQNKN